MPLTVSEIRHGIERELERVEKAVKYKILGRRRQGSIWRLEVDVAKGTRATTLDEALEGSAAWWPGQPPGSADVLSVDAMSSEINLRYCSADPPEVGEQVWVYPKRFLEALQKLWSNPELASQGREWLGRLESGNPAQICFSPTPEKFPWLRKAQREAYDLPAWDYSFLWGPPGTGKTTTLGTLVVSYLLQKAGSRILIISTTNVATDQALVACDKAAETLGEMALRRRMKRLGNHYVASYYENRTHLTPAMDERLLAKLSHLEANRPEPGDVEAYSNWKNAVEGLRKELKRSVADTLSGARVAALTASLACFYYAELAEHSFDLLVMDECSQIGRVCAAMLAPLAQAVLFAGDPQQLAPICQSTNPVAIRCLGTSAFLHADRTHKHTCFLDEQSRMAESICKVVSQLFYEGSLRVADKEKADRKWIAERTLARHAQLGNTNLYLHGTANEGSWSQKYRGPIRFESAEFIVNRCEELSADSMPGNIVVLTPFRAQRALIKTLLRRRCVRGIDVLTVHRAQGSERHTVFFDPVQGDSPFLSTPDAHCLVNVAISRAKARLVVCLSDGDRRNPLLARLGAFLSNGAGTRPPEGRPIENLVRLDDFPDCAVGVTIRTRSVVGKVLRIEGDDEYLIVLDQADGSEKRLSIPAIIKTYG